MNIALSLIPLLIQNLPGLIQLWNTTSTNASFSTKATAIAGPLGDLFTSIGSQLFPKASPTLHLIGGFLHAFNPDYTKWVQGSLNVLLPTLGITLTPLVVDGVYGEHTRDAVEAVQKHFGIFIDGIAGNITQGWIAQALAKLPQVA